MRIIILHLLFSGLLWAQSLVPAPAQYEAKPGRFVWSGGVGLSIPETCRARVTAVLQQIDLPVQAADPERAAIRFEQGAVKNPHGFRGAYQIEVAEKLIHVRAAEREGFLHAAETLRQLAEKRSMPCCVIRDWPAFPVRGFMLDTGRNFQSMELLREQIEIMARYKYNVFHFHFTDHPGWRLESRVHPRVTDASSMSRTPGKYYTQADFRALVAYCKERGIQLIPEMDMPGHSEALRKALGIQSMNTAQSRTILKELLTELASLAPAEDMPYIHIGTDEVRHGAEKVDGTFVAEISTHVRSLGREVIGWHKGLNDARDQKKITHLWARTPPLAKNPFLDSRSTYINHMDPHEAVFTFLHRAPCQVAFGNDRARGGVLCSWPDIRIENERDQIVHNAVYPAMLAYAESVWAGVKVDKGELYAANLPPVGTPEFDACVAWEKRLMRQKERDFTPENFPVYEQTQMRWRVIGPFPHGDDLGKSFPVEEALRDAYELEGRRYEWLPQRFGAATLYYNHFFGFGGLVKEKQGTCYAFTRIWSPDERTVQAFIGFHHSSRSDRRGNESATPGEWHHSLPWIKVNGEKIPPPTWKVSGPKDAETPFTDEDYQMRPPVSVKLVKGWNEILLKVPKHSKGWKWSSTFLPISRTEGLRYSAEFEASARSSQ
jgi:hypothetical protein